MKATKESIEALLEKFGSPLYVFNEQGFSENYLHLLRAMRSRYENYRIAYSFKTNYTPYICSAAKALGAYAEVVSGMEYRLAKQLGYQDKEIIFNGPDKGKDGITAFLHGCMINADSLEELQAYCEEAKTYPEQNFRIGIRVNPAIGQNFVSRFGMDEEDLQTAFQHVSRVPNLKITGLHCHISRCRNLEAWRRRTEYMLGLADRFFEDIPEYLDLGSGMFGSMDPEFAAQFDDVPSYEDYAAVTAGIAAEQFRGEERPILFTEPGTTLINRFVECVTRVESIKSIDGHFFAVLNASEHNLGEVCTLKRLPDRVISGGEPQAVYDPIDLTGYTCLEQDVLLSGYRGALAKGDYVIFGNTGGYSTVLKPPFIRPDCAMIAERPDGEYVLIKEAQSYEDVFRNYRFKDGK